jgi:hypothetical protein
MKLKLEQTYNNIYPFYESARQARTERRERNKEKKKENALKRIKIREDCLKRAIVTKGSELKKIVDSVYGYGSECFIRIGKLELRYWWCKKG